MHNVWKWLTARFGGGSKGRDAACRDGSSAEEGGLTFNTRRADVILDITVFGVDIGTQSSRVAVPRGGGFECVVSELTGSRNNPSAVAFVGEERWIGEKAQAMLVRNWAQTFTGVKRLVGLPFRSPQADLERPFVKFSTKEAPEDGTFQLCLPGEGPFDGSSSFAPEQVYAMLLCHLHQQAQAEARRG
eukprot:RCo044750